MPIMMDWSNTKQYKQHVAEHGKNAGFVDEHGVPPFPISHIGFSLMISGASTIDASNIAEVYGRLALYYEYTDSPLARKWSNNKSTPIMLNPSHVALCLGLSVNVNNMTRAKWVEYFERVTKKEGRPMTKKEIRDAVDRHAAEFVSQCVHALTKEVE